MEILMGEKHQLRKERLVNIRHHKKDGDDKTRSTKYEEKNPHKCKISNNKPSIFLPKNRIKCIL